ncbi:MAG TPA: M55 family metallopeptidase [Bacillota bacterium]|mgnify:CR=1 FL=1|nr:M55 family metallopeptidase [Bacillota bacterium]
MEKKLFFLSADIEGVTDVTSWDETEKGQEDYREAREQMTAEVSAACRAILDCGHDVIVRDGHDSARNIYHAKLPRGIKLMRGWANHPGSMVAGIDEKYAGLLFVGYHSPGGVGYNPLAHTMSASKLAYVKINGRLASEFTINRLFAAQYGVPAIFLSGDKGMCDLAAEEVPDIVTVAVKEGRGGSTFNMHPLDACDAIYEQVRKTVSMEHAAPVLPEELELEVRCIHHQAAREGLVIPGVELIDDHTIRYVAKTPTELNFIRSYVTR